MVLKRLNAMSELLQRGHDWHSWINPSGGDYLLVSSATICRLLGEYKQNQFKLLTLDEREMWARNRRHRMRTIHMDPAL